MARRGDLDGLRARANAGHWYAATRLAWLLAERSDLDGLRARADAGDVDAGQRLADLLAKRGDLDGAVQVLRARAVVGIYPRQLADLLAERGELEEAPQVLRARAVAGHENPDRLADLLIKQGRDEEAGRLRRFGLNLDGSTAALAAANLAAIGENTSGPPPPAGDVTARTDLSYQDQTRRARRWRVGILRPRKWWRG